MEELYHGRALPLCVIKTFKKYIDKDTLMNTNYFVEQEKIMNK